MCVVIMREGLCTHVCMDLKSGVCCWIEVEQINKVQCICSVFLHQRLSLDWHLLSCTLTPSHTITPSLTHTLTVVVLVVKLSHAGHGVREFSSDLLYSEPTQTGQQERVARGWVGPGSHLLHTGSCSHHSLQLEQDTHTPHTPLAHMHIHTSHTPPTHTHTSSISPEALGRIPTYLPLQFTSFHN